MNIPSFRDGWNWWVFQLAAMLLPRDPRKTVARLATGEVHLANGGVQAYRGARITEPLQVGNCLSSDEAIENAARAFRKREKVVISLDDSHSFSRKVTLPPGAGARIQNILDLEVSRVTPFTRADVVSAWFPLDSQALGETSVEHVIIRKRTISDTIASLRKTGAKPIGIVVRRRGEAALPFVLEPDGQSYGLRAFFTWAKIAGVSLAAFAICLSILGGVMLYRQSATLAAIGDLIGVTEGAALKVRQHVEKIETASREIRTLREFRERQISILDIWEELSRILPDGSWLQSLSFTQESAGADGLAQVAEDLIPSLEDSPQFEKVRFASPVFKNPDEKLARFSISFQLTHAPSGTSP